MRCHPLEGGRRQQRQPQPAVGGEALLGGEVVGVELGGVDPQAAGRRGGVDGHEPAAGRRRRRPGRAADLHGHAGRGLVVGEGVEVDVRRRRPPRGGCPGADSMTWGSSRWGAALAAAANLDENSPNDRCWLRRSMRQKVAMSQKHVVPPLPSTTS